MPDQYTLAEFGQRIKAKYPQYKDLADEDIANKVIAKYPQYKSAIKPAESDDISIAPNGPEDRTVGNYVSEAVSGVGRGLVNDVSGIAQMVMHPNDTIDAGRKQAAEADAAMAKEWRDTAGQPLGRRLGASALSGLEKAPMIGGMVQHAEEGGEQMGSPEAVGAAAEGITTFVAPELVGKALAATPNLTKGVTGTGAKTVRDLVKETKEQNLKTDAANQKLGEQHLEQTQDALHENEGRELQYKQSVKSAVDAARDKQTELDQEHSKSVQDVLHENAGKELAYQQELSKAKLESEDAYQKKLSEVEQKRLKAKQDYRKDLLDYSKKKAKLQADYQDAVDKASSETQQQAKIKPTEGRLKQAYSALRAGVETARENALRIGNSKYNKVNAKLNALPADEDAISSAVAEAKGKMKGVGADPDILKKLGARMEKDDFVYQGGQKFGPGTPLYESVKASKGGIPGGEAKPLTYEDLQGVFSELGTELSKGTLPGDTYTALDTLHEAIGSEMQRIANSKGLGAQLAQARNYWRRMKQTFGKPYSATDAATKTVRDAAGNLVSSEEQANRIRLLGSFDQRLPGLFEHVDNLTRGSEALPKAKPGRATLASVIDARKAAPPLPARPAPIPDPDAVAPRDVQQPLRKEIPDRPKKVSPSLPAQPERVSPPDRTQYTPGKKIGPAELRAAKEKALEHAANTVSHRGKWAAAWPLLGALKTVLTGGIPNPLAVGAEVGGTIAVTSMISHVMRSPKVMEFLTKATPEDVAQIPPELRGNFPQLLTQAQKRGIRISPALIRAFSASAALGARKYDVQTGTDAGSSAHP